MRGNDGAPLDTTQLLHVRLQNSLLKKMAKTKRKGVRSKHCSKTIKFKRTVFFALMTTYLAK